MKVERFENLEIWKEARELSKVVFQITEKEPFCRDFKLRDQIKASSGSIMTTLRRVSNAMGTRNLSSF
jgi:four helix bundle protein